jgi:copper chaperone
MIEFKLPDMTCGHCAGRVTQTLKAADPAAEVAIDLKAQTVQVRTREDRAALAEALADAGYPPA